MTAQPIGRHEDPRDPAVILAKLPERERERFLTEYRLAAEAAAHGVWRYKQLQELLQTWSVIAVAVNKPGYYEAVEEAWTATASGMTLEEIIVRRRAAGR
jgi:hypothetical protein